MNTKVYTVNNTVLSELIGLKFDDGQEISETLYMEVTDIEKLAELYEINPYRIICPCSTMHNCNKHAVKVFCEVPKVDEKTGIELSKQQKIDIYVSTLLSRDESEWYIDGLLDECEEEGLI